MQVTSIRCPKLFRDIAAIRAQRFYDYLRSSAPNLCGILSDNTIEQRLTK